MDLSTLLQAARRRAWLILLMVATGGLAGLAAGQLVPAVYVASARLVVEAGQIPAELAASTVQTEATEQLQIIEQKLLAREALLALAARLGLERAAAGGAIDSDAVVRDMRQRIRFVTTGGESANRGPVQAMLVTIGFTAPTAPMAAAGVDDLVDRLLREDAAMRNSVARQTLDFFVTEVARSLAALAAQDQRLLAFREAHRDALPESLPFRRDEVAALQDRLRDLERDEAGLRDQRRRVESAQAAAAVGAGPEVSAEHERLAALRADLGQAQALLAPAHPRLRLLLAQVAAQERVVAAQDAAPSAAASAIGMELAMLDAQGAHLAREREALAASLRALGSTIDATPANASTLAVLERDHADLQVQHGEAVAKKARAETGAVIEALAKGRRITVIEPASVPGGPQGPGRRLMLVAGLAGGLGLGLALAVALELLDRSIRRPEDLAARLGIAPIAVLPYLSAAGGRRTIRTALRPVAVLALAVLPLTLWLAGAAGSGAPWTA